jgi:hypothetical protein
MGVRLATRLHVASSLKMIPVIISTHPVSPDCVYRENKPFKLPLLLLLLLLL